jgi:UDP-N-acetylmuramoylalanine--D-glutamate ligase
MTIETLARQGQTEIHGSMATSILNRAGEIRKANLRQCFRDFRDIGHRLEEVANIHGIPYINDSRSTNVNSTWFALESMIRPVIWITGGADGRNDYSSLAGLVSEKVKAIICLGSENDTVLSAFRHLDKTFMEAHSMDEAVELAYLLGKKGDVVLLSPACASFDLYRDFEERGNAFRKAVRNL